MSKESERVDSTIPSERLIDFDLMNDPGIKFDIFRRLEEVRAVAPRVAYSAKSKSWIVFGREEIRQVMMDADGFSSSLLGGGGVDAPGFIPLSIDPPEHAPWRHLLSKYFGPAPVRALAPFVREWADSLITPLNNAVTCDFLKAVAEPMPVSIFMILMGLPLDRFEQFRGLVVTALSPSNNEQEVVSRLEAHTEIRAVLNDIIEQRRREPRDDLVTKLLAEQINGREITHPEMMSICYLLFLAGLDTVTNAMAFGIRHLANNMEMQEELRRDPDLIPLAVEKLLRLYTFVNTIRVCKHETEIDGITIRAGERVLCVLWSGSNEREVGHAEDTRHMAFGVGYHLCLGIHLARLELRVMYEAWFKYIGSFSLAPDSGPTMRGGAVMTISRLLLRIEPKAA